MSSHFSFAGSTMRENRYQSYIIGVLNDMFPGCVIMKNDSNYIQGIPDLIVLVGDRWAMLEVKSAEDSPMGLNQLHYVNKLNGMSFAAFIYPENEEEVLYELQSTLGRCG